MIERVRKMGGGRMKGSDAAEDGSGRRSFTEVRVRGTPEGISHALGNFDD